MHLSSGNQGRDLLASMPDRIGIDSRSFSGTFVGQLFKRFKHIKGIHLDRYDIADRRDRVLFIGGIS